MAALNVCVVAQRACTISAGRIPIKNSDSDSLDTFHEYQLHK